MVVEEGFEPSKSSDNRFTVCPLWPLGNSTTYGADDRTWTDNLLITSQLLCQLSHTSMWRLRRGSNPRPPAWQAGTLTNWATEPLKVLWWSQQGSNLWPPACKAGALPAELCDLIGGGRRIRTFEVVRQQIYSLPPLATREFHHLWSWWSDLNR